MELRSRALLIANLAKSTQFRSKAAATDEAQSSISEQQSNEIMSDFVTLVDLAQDITELLRQLSILGHFEFQNKTSVVQLGNPAGVCSS